MDLKEGLYSVSFVSSGNAVGSGVAYLVNGELHGGDAGYYYLGSYTDIGGGEGFTCRISVHHHNGPPTSVFGLLQKFELELEGLVSLDSFQVEGAIPGHSSAKIKVQGRLLKAAS